MFCLLCYIIKKNYSQHLVDTFLIAVSTLNLGSQYYKKIICDIYNIHYEFNLALEENRKKFRAFFI